MYAAEGDYVNVAISFACGIPAVGTVIAGVAKASKAVKAIKTAERIAGACRTVGKIGNTVVQEGAERLVNRFSKKSSTSSFHNGRRPGGV